MISDSVKPTVVSYSTLISSCSLSSWEGISDTFPLERVELALRFWRDMEEKGVEPNEVVFGAMLHICAKAALWERAMDIWNTMRIRNIPVDTISINSVMKACVVAGQHE